MGVNKKNAIDYAQNLSHELLTPLAVIRNNAELLLQSPNLQKDDLKYLDDILKNVRRMNNLNKSLILLSKIDNEVYEDLESINFMELVDEILENFQKLIVSKKLRVTVGSGKTDRIISNKNLMEILLQNLIKNAVIHNIDHGVIHIEFKQNAIRVANSYDTDNPPPKNHYKRFTSSKSKLGSLGLGLSIVKRICEYLNIQESHIITENKYLAEIKL